MAFIQLLKLFSIYITVLTVYLPFESFNFRFFDNLLLSSLRSKRFRGVSVLISMFLPRENWGENKKRNSGEGERRKEGFSRELRQEQRCSVKQLFSRGDLLTVLPTGFRKSLIFQVLALNLVICPLKSIVNDQINGDFGWLVVRLPPIRHRKWKIPSAFCFC